MKRFLKPLKYFTFGFLALLALGLIGNAIYKSIVNGRLERKIAVLRAAGQPVAIGDLSRPSIPPESNAATYLRRAHDDIRAIEAEFSAAFDAASKAEQDSFDAGRLSPQLKNTIQAAFEAYPKPIGLIEKAADCPEYDGALETASDMKAFQDSLANQIDDARSVVRVLGYRALLQIADGRQEDALRTCLLTFHLCRHFDRNPTIVSYLAAIACRSVAVARANQALRTGPISDSLHAELESELAKHETDEMLRSALSTERAFGLQIIYEPGRERSLGPLGLKSDAGAYIDLIDKAISEAGLPYSDATATLVMYVGLSKAPLTRSVVPPLPSTLTATARIRAELRSLRILNALTLRTVDDAAEPKLADLGLPAEVTVDPFDGGQLHLKKLPDGWLIYSVGRNQADDGGNLIDTPTSLDVGLGPASATD